MRIGFDVSPLHRPFPRGVVRATSQLVGALERRGSLEVVRLEPPRGGSLASWRRGLPREVRERGLVGLHSPISAFPLRGAGARVQTIHELPWRHGVRENADWRHRFWASVATRFADRVLCPSEHVARALRSMPLAANKKVRVCPWGIGAPFEPEPPLGTVDEAILERYRLPEEPLLLCLGAVRPKKNLAAVLHGMHELARRGGRCFHLVVTGGDTPQLRRDLGLTSKLGLTRSVTTLDEIDEADLPALLRLATAVAVLSRSEGFGFPALEALACGTPAIVARDSAQAEVAGEAGIVVDPDDPSSVAAGLERALEERMVAVGVRIARAAELSWERAASIVEDVWREIAER